MIQIKSICDQIEKMAKLGFLSYPFTVNLNEKDYEDAWKDNGGWCPSTCDEFSLYTVGGIIYFQKRIPDYVDGYSYYYFNSKISISDYGSTYGHEIHLIKLDPYNEWKRYDLNGTGMLIPYFVRERLLEFLQGKSETKTEANRVCWHNNKKAVYLFTSAYWCCVNCGCDCGTLTDAEFYENLKGRKM